jgi:hypothetical protein
MQLAPGSMAEQWFDDIVLNGTMSFSWLKNEFMLQWPLPRAPKYSRVQQKECVLAQVLKEEDIGVWVPGKPTGNYGHVNWATKVMRLALGMGDNAGF